MKAGDQICGSKRVWWGALSLLAVGICFSARGGDEDKAAKTPPKDAPVVKPAETRSRVPRPTLTPSLHPEDPFHFNSGPSMESFSIAPPPIAPQQAPIQPFTSLPPKEQIDVFGKQNWMLPKESPTGAAAVNKLFGVPEYHLLGSEDKGGEELRGMQRYMNASKPSSSPAKAVDASLWDQNRKEPGKTGEPNSFAVQTPKTGLDKWNEPIGRGVINNDPSTAFTSPHDFRPNWYSPVEEDKAQIARQEEFRRELNMPTDHITPRAERWGLLESVTATLPNQAFPDSSAIVKSFGNKPLAPGSSPFDQPVILDTTKAPQLPSLSVPAPNSLNQARSMTLTTEQPRQVYQPAVLPLPVRPGSIQPY